MVVSPEAFDLLVDLCDWLREQDKDDLLLDSSEEIVCNFLDARPDDD